MAKSVEIVVELLNEGMKEEEVKEELLEMGLSGGEINKLIKDAKNLRGSTHGEHSVESRKFMAEIPMKGGDTKDADEGKRAENAQDPGAQRRFVENKLQRLKGAITAGSGKVQVGPSQSPQKEVIGGAKTESSRMAEGQEEEVAAGMMNETEKIIAQVKAQGKTPQETGEEDDEMNEEKLDQIIADLGQIKKGLKVLEELNIKLAEIIKSKGGE